jgi:hypothetical protein
MTRGWQGLIYGYFPSAAPDRVSYPQGHRNALPVAACPFLTGVKEGTGSRADSAPWFEG